MKKHIRATWVSRKETSIFCCSFGGFKGDRQGLAEEVEASLDVICQYSPDSMLVAVDMYHPHFTPELLDFFRVYSNPQNNPIRRMAIIYVSPFQRFWYQRRKGVVWPRNARFFDDYEKAKDWLVGEIF
jgi:hypothetical protein